MDILFKNATIITMNDEEIEIKDGFLGIDDGKITYLSKKQPKILAKREIDAKGKVLLSGLVNTHTHIPMSILRGFAEDLELSEWLYDNIFPAEAKIDEKCVEISSKLTIAEMLSTGTTSITDMYFKAPTIAKVLAETGMRGHLCNASLCFEPQYNENDDNAYKEFCQMYEQYHNYDNGRIKIDAGIHGEYTSNENVWKFWSKLACDKDINMHVHVSETKKEHEECKKRHNGKTPVQVLSENGVFNTKSTLAHCVYITEEDMDILIEKGATVAHNPVSNLKLASGIAPVAKMLEKGVNVSLGTDGVASNNTHDLFEEIKLSAILAKGATNNPKAVVAKQALQMATINGGKSQNRDNSLKIGNDADVIMIDFDNLSHTPTHDVISALVYNTCGCDVCMTIVNGKILYEDGKFTTIDIENVKKELYDYAIPRIK